MLIIQLLQDRLLGFVQTVFSTATLCSRDLTSQDVRYATRVLMFVPVLASGTGPTIPLDLEILFIELDFLNDLGINNGNSNGRGMNSTFSFCRRDSLETMSARFFTELCQIVANYLDGNFATARTEQAVLSADAGEVLDVCRSQIVNKQLAVFSAFCGAYFNETHHCALLL